MDDFVRYGIRMRLRTAMTSALRARRLERGLSLEQVGRKAGLARSAVHAIETAVSGEYLDRLEALAEALGARWELVLVPAEDTAPRMALLRAAAALPVVSAPELLAVLGAWSELSADDRELVAHLCARRAARVPAEVVEMGTAHQVAQQRQRSGS